MEVNQITGTIIDAALRVHSKLGPGLLESVYEACLEHELRTRGLRVQRQVLLPVWYDGVCVEKGYRLDLVVEGRVIIELKCVDALAPIHKAQLLSYLKLANKEVGLLINWQVVHLRDGIKRVVNECRSDLLSTSSPSASTASSAAGK